MAPVSLPYTPICSVPAINLEALGKPPLSPGRKAHGALCLLYPGPHRGGRAVSNY